MTKHEYLVEEVRPVAKYMRGLGKHQVADLLDAYANLREQIERARGGVTDEVVKMAATAYLDSHEKNWDLHDGIRAALQSVAHLSPSGERREAAIGFRHRMKGSGPEWSYNYHRAPDSFELRECEIETIWAGNANPPAQAAQVDDKVVVIHDGKTTTEGLVLAAAIYMGAMKDIFALRPDGQPYNERRVTKDTGALRAFDHLDAATKALRSAISHFNAPTAEPVAQGDASWCTEDNSSLCRKAAGNLSMLLSLCREQLHPDECATVQEIICGLQAAQPRAVPDGWSGWCTKYPGRLPKLWGAREIAELNYYPEEGQRLFQVAELAAPQPGEPS